MQDSKYLYTDTVSQFIKKNLQIQKNTEIGILTLIGNMKLMIIITHLTEKYNSNKIKRNVCCRVKPGTINITQPHCLENPSPPQPPYFTTYLSDLTSKNIYSKASLLRVIWQKMSVRVRILRAVDRSIKT